MTLRRSLQGRLSGSRKAAFSYWPSAFSLNLSTRAGRPRDGHARASGSDFQKILFRIGDDGFVVSVSGEAGLAYDANARGFHFLYQTIGRIARTYGDRGMPGSRRLVGSGHQFEPRAGAEPEEAGFEPTL